jgi:hypothetical protein
LNSRVLWWAFVSTITNLRVSYRQSVSKYVASNHEVWLIRLVKSADTRDVSGIRHDRAAVLLTTSGHSDKATVRVKDRGDAEACSRNTLSEMSLIPLVLQGYLQQSPLATTLFL